MSRIFVAGLGAVSPAGWSVAALNEALRKAQPLPIQHIEPTGREPLSVRLVPTPATRPQFLAHPRLRRSSPITHYATAAAIEAVAKLRKRDGSPRLGLIACFQAGCVNYSRRFLDEILKDPLTASPLLFPETVYAGPVSHVAALLGNVSITYSLVGDAGCFLQGVSLGAQWLTENRVDVCIIIGAEETDWILADALWHIDRSTILAGGAGALCLCCDSTTSVGVQLATITDPHTYSSRNNRERAARAMRSQLGEGSSAEMLCDGIGESSRANAAERAAWHDWLGARLSLKKILGEGLMAGAAWQCVAACEAIASGQFTAANVSIVGSNQQAIGARFIRTSRSALELPAGAFSAHTLP